MIYAGKDPSQYQHCKADYNDKKDKYRSMTSAQALAELEKKLRNAQRDQASRGKRKRACP